jgi:hypothetical protein
MPAAGQEYQALQSREVLNERGDSTPLRGANEGSSSDDEDGSPTESLTKSPLDGTPRRSPPRVGEHAAIDGRRSQRPWRRFCSWLKPSKRVCILICVVVAAVLGAAIGGGAWVYKSAPRDGLSPPWYPTPQGGTVKTWEKSYEKARELVGKMSLVEKVNITTGTGYVQSSLKCASHLTCSADGRWTCV